MSYIRTPSDFRKEAHKMADWLADYFEQIENYPVKSQVNPGDIKNKIPDEAPLQAESMEEIMKDFNEIIMPGITHWQHPSFFAYFPANTSFPSILAEMLTAGLAQQGMIWETSPAATELEERMMLWIRRMCGLPQHFTGVIQDTASTSTLVALLTAREKISGYTINKKGFTDGKKYRIYCTSETHSSIEKAARIAGFGSENLVQVAIDGRHAMRPEALKDAIYDDYLHGFIPCCVVATIGTTGCAAADPIYAIGEVCKHFNIWLHVDAAYAGTAMVVPIMRHFIRGIELADSYVFNPHKWMFTNFDCSAYYVADKEALIRTFEILPEYLKTEQRGEVNNYRDWGIQLGRRFRALKLWFVIRNFGAVRIREFVTRHLEMAEWITEKIALEPDFDLLAFTRFGLVCFRYQPLGIKDEIAVDELNRQLEKQINDSGKMYISHTVVNGKYTLRLVVGQTYVQQRHVEAAFERIIETARNLTPITG
jgi:aromatic-L-amino-acid/L-tryptophan decarboxylase